MMDQLGKPGPRGVDEVFISHSLVHPYAVPSVVVLVHPSQLLTMNSTCQV